jgi:transposase
VDVAPHRGGDRAAIGVRFHPGHVWRLLRRLDWSLQRPARRAIERDEAEIARWHAQD